MSKREAPIRILSAGCCFCFQKMKVVTKRRSVERAARSRCEYSATGARIGGGSRLPRQSGQSEGTTDPHASPKSAAVTYAPTTRRRNRDTTVAVRRASLPCKGLGCIPRCLKVLLGLGKGLELLLEDGSRDGADDYVLDPPLREEHHSGYAHDAELAGQFLVVVGVYLHELRLSLVLL